MKASREHKPQLSRSFQLCNNRHPIQCVRTIVIEAFPFLPTYLTFNAITINNRKHGIHWQQFLNNGGNPQMVPMISNVGTFSNPGGTINQNETLILVSHGSRYLPFFGFRTPFFLARKLFNSNILPIGYQGEIYLDGCYTGEPGPFGHLGDGSSFAERFKVALNNLYNNNVLGQFTVKGNLGATQTNRHGREYNDLDTRSIKFINQNIIRRNIDPNQRNKYMPFARLHNFVLNTDTPQMAGKYGKVIY